MKQSILMATLLGAMVATVFGQPAGWDVYKYSVDPPPNTVLVPDVDKTAPPPPPPNPGMTDNSCWMATAANILGASGYGQGANAQARATGIYNQLAFDLGWWNLGNCELAVNYWLYTYGKNPGIAGQVNPDYNPGNTYTDVTAKYGAIPLNNYVAPPGVNTGYNWLLDELKRCQYIGIQLSGTPDHCVTLVGGNYWNNPNGRPTGNAVIIHDSDFDKGNGPNPPNDDVYNNVPDVSNNWQMVYDPLGPPGQVRPVTGYVTLCPGLNNPAAAVANYDVAYYKADLNRDGDWNPIFREAGAMAGNYTDPSWYDSVTLHLGNQEMLDQHKEVYLLVDYLDRVAGRAANENVRLQAWNVHLGQVVLVAPTSVQASTDNGQLLFTWILDFQPPWENIIFPDARYSLLNGNVKDWDVATICIPEPATLGLTLLGAVMLLRRRRLN